MSESSRPRRRTIRSSDLLALAGSSLRANFLRSSLTILGVAIGVFSVVGVMTALSAIRLSIDTAFSVFGTNVLQIQRDPAIQLGGPGGWRQRRPSITPREAQRFKDMMEATGIPTALSAGDGGERVVYGDKRTNRNITIQGTNEHFLLTNKYELAYGRNISAADVEFNRPIIVLGHDVAEQLFPAEDPLDKLVVADGDRYTVVGVLEPRGDMFGESLDSLVLIPYHRFVANNWHRWRSMSIAFQAPSAEELAATEDLAIGAMRLVRELEPEDENNFEVTSNEALQATYAEIAFLIGTGGLAISSVALVCAGVGIMAIMLVSVTERTREIGVRKSLGARKVSILLQFLLEAIFLSEAGALIGILLGMAVGNALAAQLNASMIIPWFWMAVAVGVCSLIGVGFGLYPAWRAANLNPVEALRYE
ncbi:MAG: ABC transporter permease [Verrucomicrobiota bacterium]